MSIREILFFTHRNNQLCGYLQSIIDQYRIPVTPIRVHSKAIASRVRGAVKNIPTLIVVLDNGSRQKYEGDDCRGWLLALIEQSGLNGASALPSRDDESGSESEEILDSDDDDGELLESEEERGGEGGGGTKSMTMSSGKIDIAAVTQQAEHERAEMEKRMNPKKIRGRRGGG